MRSACVLIPGEHRRCSCGWTDLPSPLPQHRPPDHQHCELTPSHLATRRGTGRTALIGPIGPMGPDKPPNPAIYPHPSMSIRDKKPPLHSWPFVVQITPSSVAIRVHSWSKSPLHSCPFVVQNTPSFAPIRGHSWFKPPLHSPPFVAIRGSNTPAFAPIRGHSWFKPPLHSHPFVSIRGSKHPCILTHSWFQPPLQLSESPDTRTQSQTNPHNARACGNLYCEHH